MKQPTLSTDFIRRQPTRTPTEAAKPSPDAYLDNRVIKSQRQSRRKRSESARSRLSTKKHLAQLADSLGEVELSHKLKQCHSRVSVLHCGRHVVQIIPNFTCEFRLCPDCARRRARKIINKYLRMMLAFMLCNRVTPTHLVLTQAHRSESREQSIKRLKAAFRKLQRREFWKKHFKGGTWSVELTKGADGLHHTHLHIIGFRRKFFDIELLRAEWLAVTGDSHVLRLDPIRDVATGLREVVKYVTKPLDIHRFGASDLKEFLELKNARFFGTFGEFRDFCKSYEPSDNDDDAETELKGLTQDLVEGCACPQCGNPLKDSRMSANELVQFYERVEASPSPPPLSLPPFGRQ